MRKPAGPPDRPIGWLTVRADYLSMQSGLKAATPFFVLQVRPQPDPSQTFSYRVGFTASRKVGNAVVRNRARRRLRELVRLHLADLMPPGHDLVVIARTPAAIAPFPVLRDHFTRAIARLKLTPETNQEK